MPTPFFARRRAAHTPAIDPNILVQFDPSVASRDGANNVTFWRNTGSLGNVADLNNITGTVKFCPDGPNGHPCIAIYDTGSQARRDATIPGLPTGQSPRLLISIARCLKMNNGSFIGYGSSGNQCILRMNTANNGRVTTLVGSSSLVTPSAQGQSFYRGWMVLGARIEDAGAGMVRVRQYRNNVLIDDDITMGSSNNTNVFFTLGASFPYMEIAHAEIRQGTFTDPELSDIFTGLMSKFSAQELEPPTTTQLRAHFAAARNETTIQDGDTILSHLDIVGSNALIGGDPVLTLFTGPNGLPFATLSGNTPHEESLPAANIPDLDEDLLMFAVLRFPSTAVNGSGVVSKNVQAIQNAGGLAIARSYLNQEVVSTCVANDRPWQVIAIRSVSTGAGTANVTLWVNDTMFSGSLSGLTADPSQVLSLVAGTGASIEFLDWRIYSFNYNNATVQTILDYYHAFADIPKTCYL